jgi:hypothetical protein
MRLVVLGLVLLSGCDGQLPLAERESSQAGPEVETVGAPTPSASASSCPTAIKPPGNVATQRVKVRSYTADRSSVRFFLEPKGAGKAPFEVIAGSQNLSNLLLSALDAQREVEVAVKQDSCVPEVVFVRSP